MNNDCLEELKQNDSVKEEYDEIYGKDENKFH